MKKTFLLTILVCSAAMVMAQRGKLVLEDNSLLVAFDANTGAITRMERKTTGWVLERRPELGVSFRMHVPLADRRFNFVLGQKQKLQSAEQVSSSEIRLQWDNLMSENGGELPISLKATITLKNGALTFDASVDNRSDLVVETIDYPYFGDLNAPSKNDRLDVRTMWYGNLGSEEVYPHFNNSKGYWGVFYPTKTFDSFRSLFCLIQGKHQGLYVEMHNPTQPYLIEYTFEQHPGVVQSVDNPLPQQDEISGMPVNLQFRTCHFIFAQPHTRKDLVPIVLRGYDGDWHKAVDIYKEWRTTRFKPAHEPAWLQDVHSWLQLQINSPEQDYRVKFKELLTYG
jgi:hypothetical protein